MLKIMNGKIEGSITIVEDTKLKGMIVGDVIVAENIEFKISGMVIGNLTINKNSIVKINGMINGDVINSGGNLEVYGIIGGTLLKQSGKTFVDKDAKIN